MDKREEIKPDAWVIRSPETGKVLWHEAEGSRSAFSPDWIEDGWEVVPVYLGSALSQASLSEAVKVLERTVMALEPFAEAEEAYPHFREDNEYADQHEFQLRDLRAAERSLSQAKSFIATLGEIKP